MRIVQLIALAVLMMFTLIVGGCGGGGSSSSVTPENVTGQFVDSLVVGINYTCSSGLSGSTNTNGEFTCQEGDTVEFLLGDYSLGSCAVQEIVTPYDLYPDNDVAAVNVAQLLQTIDENEDPSDGITVPTLFSLLDSTATLPTAADFDAQIAVVIGQVLVVEEVARDHLAGTINQSQEIPFAILDWRTLENGNDYGVGWIALPQLLPSEAVADLKLVNSLGQTVMTFSDFTYDVDHGSVFIDCTSGTCADGVIVEDKGYYTNYEPYPVGAYTFALETSQGEILEKDAIFKGVIRMPVILASSISPSWNEDGSLTVAWENPTTDQDWDLVKQVRIDLSSLDGESNLNVRFLENYGTSMTIPASELAKTFTSDELLSIKIRMQTRAIDADGYHYARGRSGWFTYDNRFDGTYTATVYDSLEDTGGYWEKEYIHNYVVAGKIVTGTLSIPHYAPSTGETAMVSMQFSGELSFNPSSPSRAYISGSGSITDPTNGTTPFQLNADNTHVLCDTQDVQSCELFWSTLPMENYGLLGGAAAK